MSSIPPSVDHSFAVLRSTEHRAAREGSRSRFPASSSCIVRRGISSAGCGARPVHVVRHAMVEVMRMAVNVTVGPPVITINHGSTFLVSEFDGSITDASDQGLYSRDTRYLSRYQLYIDGKPWIFLNSGAIAYYASRTYLVNPRVLTEHGTIEAGTVGLVLG